MRSGIIELEVLEETSLTAVSLGAHLARGQCSPGTL